MSFLSRSAIVEILDFGKGNLKIRNNRLRNKRRTGSRVRRREKKKDKKDRHTAAGITLCDRRPLAKILIASVAVLHNFVMHPVKRNTIVSFARRENARGCFAPLSVHRLRLRKPDRLELSAKFIQLAPEKIRQRVVYQRAYASGNEVLVRLPPVLLYQVRQKIMPEKILSSTDFSFLFFLFFFFSDFDIIVLAFHYIFIFQCSCYKRTRFQSFSKIFISEFNFIGTNSCERTHIAVRYFHCE